MDGLLLASSVGSASDRSSNDADGSSVDESIASAHQRIRPLRSHQQPTIHHAQLPNASPEENANKRLQDLSHHLQHLHELYAQELGREKAEARESFLQKMCTCSITLLRHCKSRSRFYTAVRALLCQYVPASDAKLIQVEPAGDGRVFLVLPDELAFDLANPIGIAGHAVQALQQKLGPQDTDELLALHSSSISIHSAQSQQPPWWLTANSDCVYPSANGHLMLLLPISSTRHANYDRSVDLHLRKREHARKAHLLVMVLRASSGKPVGVIEALLPTPNKDQIDFLDAFGVILASALETRLVICRSILESVQIQIIPERDEASRFSRRKSVPLAVDEAPELSLPLVDRSHHKVLVFGRAAVRQAHDRVVLEALKQPLTCILDEAYSTKCQLKSYESIVTACGWLWSQVAEIETGENSLTICRRLVEQFFEKIVHHDRQNNLQRIQLRLLFQTESMETFAQIYGDDHGDLIGNKDSELMSVQGQFAMLQQGIRCGEEATPSERVLIIPIRMHNSRNNDGSNKNKLEENQNCEAAIMVICPECCTRSEACDFPIHIMMRQHIVPRVVWFVHSMWWQLKRHTDHKLMIQELKDLGLQHQDLVKELAHIQCIQLLDSKLRVCNSLDDIVVCVNSHITDAKMFKLNITKFTLFIATKKVVDDDQMISSRWTVDAATREKIFQYSSGINLKYSDECVLSIPIHDRERDSRPCLGILELSFLSVRERDEFILNNEAITSELERMINDFITIHEVVDAKEQQLRQLQQLSDEESALRWDRWNSFLQVCTSLASCSDSWKDEIVSSLLKLVPSSDFANVFCPDLGDVENSEIADRIWKETEDYGLSSCLNLINGAILQSVLSFQLIVGSSLGSEREKKIGVIVFSKRSPDFFSDDEKQAGAMAARVLSVLTLHFEKELQLGEASNAIQDITREKANLETQIVDQKVAFAALHRHRKLLTGLVSMMHSGELLCMTRENLAQEVICKINEFTGSISVNSGNGEESKLQASAESHLILLEISSTEHKSVTHVTTASCNTVDLRPSDRQWMTELSTHVKPIDSCALSPATCKSLRSFLPISEESGRFIVVPISHSTETESLQGLLVAASSGHSSLFSLSEVSWMQLSLLIGSLFEQWNLLVFQQREKHRAEGELVRIQSDKKRLEIEITLCNFFHGLWTEVTTLISRESSWHQWKEVLQLRLCKELSLILCDSLNILDVQLAIREDLKSHRSTETGTSQQFVAKFMNQNSAEVRVFQASWKNGSNVGHDNERVKCVLQLIVDRLSVLFLNGMVFENIMASKNEVEKQMDQLVERDVSISRELAKLEHSNEQYCSALTMSCKLLNIRLHYPNSDVEDYLRRVVEIVNAFDKPQLKLWVVDHDNGLASTIVDGVKQSRSIQDWRDNRSTELTQSPTLIDLFDYENPASPVSLLGCLELTHGEQTEVYDREFVIQTVACVLRHVLSTRNQLKRIYELKDQVSSVASESKRNLINGLQHTNRILEHIRLLDQEVSKWTLLNDDTHANFEIDLESGIKKLQGSANGVLLQLSDAICNNDTFMAPLLTVRSLFVSKNDRGPSKWRSASCTCDAKSCQPNFDPSFFEQLMVDVAADKSIIWNANYSASPLTRRAPDPLLSLVFPSCDEKKTAHHWQLVNSPDNATHQLLLVPTGRNVNAGYSTIPDTNICLVYMCVIQGNDDKDCKEWDNILRIFAKRIMDAYLTTLQLTSLSASTHTLKDQVQMSESTALSAFQMQDKLLRITVQVMPLLSAAMNSIWSSDENIILLVEDMVRIVCGSDAIVRLCVFGDDIMNGNSKNTKTTGLQLNTTQRCDINSIVNPRTFANKSGAYRNVLTLLDANKAEIGELVLQFREDVQFSSETNQLIDLVAQFVGLIVGIMLQNKVNSESLQALRGDYETLLTEKAQLEVNCLEMKNHLHSGEADRSELRGKLETILDAGGCRMADFVDQLSQLTERHGLLQALTKAVSSTPSVVASQLQECNTGLVKNILFTIAEKKSARKLLNSEKVEVIVQRSIREAEIVIADIDTSCSVVSIPIKLARDVDPIPSAILKPSIKPEKLDDLCVLSVIIVHKSASDLKAYYLDRLRAMAQLTKLRLQSIAQENSFIRQIQIMEGKEEILESRLTLLETKCTDWQLKYGQHIIFYQGLSEELAGANALTTTLWPSSVPTSKLTDMWQQLVGILHSQLQLMLRHSKPVVGQGVQLYGVVKEGHFWFSLPSNAGSYSKQIQCISFAQIMQSKSTQAIWQAYASEQAVEMHRTNDLNIPDKDRNQDKREVSLLYLPLLHSMGDIDSPNVHSVVGVMELRTESILDCAEIEIIQGALRVIAPYAQWVGSMIHRKQRQKAKKRAAQLAQDTASGTQQINITAPTNARSAMIGFNVPSVKPNKVQSTDLEGAPGSKPVAFSNENNVNDTESYADDDEDDDLPRKSRINVATGLIPFLLEMHRTKDISNLNQLVHHAMTSIWAPRIRCGKQYVSKCHIFITERFLENCFIRDQDKSEWRIPAWIEDAVQKPHGNGSGRLWKFQQNATGEHHWILEISEVMNNRSTELVGYLLISGCNLEKIFDKDDERTILLQLAEAVRLKIAHFSEIVALQDQSRQLHTIQAQVVEFTSKCDRMELEARVSQIVDSFAADIMDVNSETELISLSKVQLKKMQKCSHVVFRGSNPHPKQLIAENDSDDFVVHESSQDSDESVLEMKNIMRLHVFAPRLLGTALLGTFVVAMDNQALPMSSTMQKQLRRFASVVGMALSNIRSVVCNTQQQEAYELAQNDNQRLEQEIECLQAQILEFKQDKQQLQQQIGLQAGIQSNNVLLEAEVGKLTSQLNDWAQWKVEEDARVASNEKTIAHLTTQLQLLQKLEIRLRQSEEENLELRERERRSEKKLLKYRLQMKQLVSEMLTYKRKEEYDAHERVKLQTQVAVLKEHQYREPGHAAPAASTVHSHQNRSLHQLRHQHHEQNRKQLQLAQELRQLAAMEARELKSQAKNVQHQDRVVHTRNRVAVHQTTHNSAQVDRSQRAAVLPVTLSAPKTD